MPSADRARMGSLPCGACCTTSPASGIAFSLNVLSHPEIYCRSTGGRLRDKSQINRHGSNRLRFSYRLSLWFATPKQPAGITPYQTDARLGHKELTGFDRAGLQLGLQHHVEGRFGGAADAFKAALHDYFLETRLACLRAERKTNLLRERSRRADSRRCGIKQCTDRVEVVFEPVVGEWLDNHPGAIWRQRLADVMRGAGRVAHVVKTIEEADQIKSLGREILRRTGLERDQLADAGFASGFARRFYRVHMIVVADEFRIGEGLRHQNGGSAMAAPDIRNAATLLQLRHDTIQRRQPFVDKVMIVGGAEDALGTAEQAAIVFVPGQRPIRLERADNLRHIME